MTLDPTIVSLLTNGGFATLFVWLLVTTRNESRAREERLLTLLEQYSSKLPQMAESLRKIEEQMMHWEAR